MSKCQSAAAYERIANGDEAGVFFLQRQSEAATLNLSGSGGMVSDMNMIMSLVPDSLGYWTDSSRLAFDEPQLKKWVNTFKVIGMHRELSADQIMLRDVPNKVSFAYIRATTWDGFKNDLYDRFSAGYTVIRCISGWITNEISSNRIIVSQWEAHFYRELVEVVSGEWRWYNKSVKSRGIPTGPTKIHRGIGIFSLSSKPPGE